MHKELDSLVEKTAIDIMKSMAMDRIREKIA
jgi:hypothetical protein